MSKEIVEMVMSRLDAVAIRLGMAVEQIWPWLVRNQYIDALFSLALLIFFSLIGRISYYFIKEIKWGNESITERAIVAIIGIISVFGIVSSFIYFLSEFPDIFNAEYWALKDLIGMVR